MLHRMLWHIEADAILAGAAAGHVTCAVTANSLTNVFYVGRRSIGTTQARNDLRVFLGAFEVLPIEKQTLLAADAMSGTDFEDNIEIAAAVIAGLDAIVTRNPSDFQHSSISVWQPGELASRIAAVNEENDES